MEKVEKFDLKEVIRQNSRLLIIGAICLAVVIGVRILVAVTRDSPKARQAPASIEELPEDVQVILKELEKEEYRGKSQKEIEEALRWKGIHVPKK